MNRVEAPPKVKPMYADAPFGPVRLWRADDKTTHGLAADGRHVHIELPTVHLQVDGRRLLDEGVRVTIDGAHIATLRQHTHGWLRKDRVVHIDGAIPGLVPDGAFFRCRRLSDVDLETVDRTLVSSRGVNVFGGGRVRIADGVHPDLALVYVVAREAVKFAVRL